MRDIYSEITERFIEQLEQGVMPWRKPWVSGNNKAYNNSSNSTYNFLNQCLLPQGGAWDTFKGWTSKGARITKGVHGSQIVQRWYWISKDGKKVSDKDIESAVLRLAHFVPYTKVEYNGETYVTQISLKWLTVFHITQTDGTVPAKREVKTGSLSADEKNEQAESILRGYLDREHIGFTEEEQGNEAYYVPFLDSITVPRRDMFCDLGEFYSTAFHEATHSTGKRLGRELDGKFGSKEYAKEELVAEMGSAFILNSIGIENEGTFKNSSAYIASWLSHLNDDKKFVYSACANAEKASEYIMRTA